MCFLKIMFEIKWQNGKAYVGETSSSNNFNFPFFVYISTISATNSPHIITEILGIFLYDDFNDFNLIRVHSNDIFTITNMRMYQKITTLEV